MMSLIINKEMVVKWIKGMWMEWEILGFKGGWMKEKIIIVVIMQGVNGYI